MENIKIKVVNKKGDEVYVILKPDTSFIKLINAYCYRKGLLKDNITFTYGDQKINELDTPTSLNIKDGDLINVILLK